VIKENKELEVIKVKREIEELMVTNIKTTSV
jgi:hypothetical protein